MEYTARRRAAPNRMRDLPLSPQAAHGATSSRALGRRVAAPEHRFGDGGGRSETAVLRGRRPRLTCGCKAWWGPPYGGLVQEQPQSSEFLRPEGSDAVPDL